MFQDQVTKHGTFYDQKLIYHFTAGGLSSGILQVVGDRI